MTGQMKRKAEPKAEEKPKVRSLNTPAERREYLRRMAGWPPSKGN